MLRISGVQWLTAYYGVLFADIRLRAPIPLYGPPGTADRLAHFLSPLKLTTRSVEHGMPAFAVRVETGETSLVYSGDTAPCANLTDLATDCAALLCEAESASAPTDGPQVHHTPEDTGPIDYAAPGASFSLGPKE